MRDIEDNSSAFKKKHRKDVAKKTGGCDRCHPHSGENVNLKGKKPKPDIHKNKKRDSIRKGAIEKVRREVSPEQFG